MISRNSLIYWHDVMSAATVQATHNHIHISYIMHHQPAQSYKIRWTHGTVCAQLHWQQQKNKRRRVDDSDFHMNGSSSGFFGSILPANNTLNRWQHTKLIIINVAVESFVRCDVMWCDYLPYSAIVFDTKMLNRCWRIMCPREYNDTISLMPKHSHVHTHINRSEGPIHRLVESIYLYIVVVVVVRWYLSTMMTAVVTQFV